MEDVLVDESLEDGLDKSDILVVGDTAAIVNFRTEIVQHSEINLVVVIQEHLQLSATHIEIFKGESVWDIPSNGTELTSILDNSVEE